jgi:hypothetical protein
MQKARNIDRDSAPIPWAAVANARMLNIANASLYTDAQKARGLRMAYALELCYKADGIHVNYRKTFIAVKVDNAQVWNRKELLALEASWGNDVQKIITKQGIIYRIKFA